MNGKERRLHLLYDLGDGGLVTRNVCAYFQNWYHDRPSTTVCWVPTRWRGWILSLEDVKGWEVGRIFSSLGLPFLRLKGSGWGWSTHWGTDLPQPGGCRSPRGAPDGSTNHKNTCLQNSHFLYFFKKDFIYLFLDKGKGESERERETYQCVIASHTASTGDLACNPGMCPDQELNQRLFDSQAGIQSTEPQQPGLTSYIYME